jgi:predicted nucleic acid-binding Zn ribbon protein
MKALSCPHCQTPGPDTVKVCRGCGAEVIRGASRRERSLIGLAFVMAALFIAVAVLRALEIARGAPPLSGPKAEDGLLFFLGLIAVIVIPYIVGTRVAHELWRSRIRFYRTFQHR